MLETKISIKYMFRFTLWESYISNISQQSYMEPVAKFQGINCLNCLSDIQCTALRH